MLLGALNLGFLGLLGFKVSGPQGLEGFWASRPGI